MNSTNREDYDRSRSELRKMGVEFPQNDNEFLALLDFLGKMRITNLVEVGTREGGSLFMLSRVLCPNATIVSVDLPGLRWGWAKSAGNKRKTAERLQQDGFKVHLVERNSQLSETAEEVKRLLDGAPIQLLFLDADHTFNGVLADFLNFHPLVDGNALIVFHDIVELPTLPDVQVHFLWKLLKGFMPFAEFIDHEGKGYGIGLIRNVRLPQGRKIIVPSRNKNDAADRGCATRN